MTYLVLASLFNLSVSVTFAIAYHMFFSMRLAFWCGIKNYFQIQWGKLWNRGEKYANNCSFLWVKSPVWNDFVHLWVILFNLSLSLIHSRCSVGLCNCHCDLWCFWRINHLNLTSLYILQTKSFPGTCFVFSSPHSVEVVFFRNMLNVCMVYAMVQMQCRRNWYNWTNERWVRVLKKQMMKKKTILIAAKCLIFSAWTPTGKWNAARTCSIIWQRYGKAASERTSEKRSQNESEQIVIFHLYWWNMVRCICAINHSVSAMIHLQQQTVHLLRLFWIQWCCIASKTQTTKIYALAFSTLILPNFFRLVFFSSFTFRYTYIVCIKCIQFILCSWSKRVKKKFNLSKIPRSSNFSRNSMDFFLLFIFICGCNKFVDNNKFHWLTET